MSALRRPSIHLRISSVSGGSPCAAVKASKASMWNGMLSSRVPSMSKTTPATRRAWKGLVIVLEPCVRNRSRRRPR